MSRFALHDQMDACDYYYLQNRLLVGTGAHTRKAARDDLTVTDFAMQPPVRVTRHAKERLKQRTASGTLPVYAPGTRRSVVVTHVPAGPTRLRLKVSPGKLIGRKGCHIQNLRAQSGAHMRVSGDYVLVWGSDAQRSAARNLLRKYVHCSFGV